MQKGTVKFYNDQRGFGFIQPDGGGKDVFVHATALERAGMRGLVEGQKVSFDTQEDRRTGKIGVANISAAQQLGITNGNRPQLGGFFMPGWAARTVK
jgi:CspA family cold shock protein